MAVARARPQSISRAGIRLARKLWRLGSQFIPGICAFAVVAVVAIANGGFDSLTWRLSTIALAALAAAGLVVRERIRVGRLGWLMLLALAALAAWIELSQFWSSNAAAALPEFERALVYVSGAAAAVLAIRRSEVPQLAAGVLAGVTFATLYGLVPYLFKDVPLNPVEGTLLFNPLGYANAVGIFAAIGIVLSVGLALAGRRRVERALAAAPLVALVPALYFTSSRGAWVALAAGLVAMLYLQRRIGPVAMVGLLGVAVVAALLLGSSKGQSISLFGENRPRYWHVAWLEYTLHPWSGSGAGTFVDYWLHHRSTGEFARDAHSLYLETLAELGPVGLALLAVAFAAPLAALRSRQTAVVAAAGGAYTAFVVHAAIDWDWELPAVTLTGILCGAAALLGARSGAVRPLPPRLRAAVLALVVTLGVFAVVRLQRSDIGI